MTKTFVALAISTTWIVPAMADVTAGPVSIYGTAQSAVENIHIAFAADRSSDNTADTSKTSQTRLMDQSSKIGFKFSQELDGAVIGLAQVESRFYLGNGGNNTQNKAELGSRNTFVGLASSQWGILRLGRYDNAYKANLKAAASAIANTLNDASSESGDKQIFARLGARQGDLLAYESPRINGFQVLASYNLGKDSDNGLGAADFVAANATTKQPAVSQLPGTLMPQNALSLGYAQGPVSAAIAYTAISNAAWQLDASSSTKAAFNTAPGATFGLSAYQVGAQYAFGNYAVGGVYEVTSSYQKNVSAMKDFDLSQATYAVTGAYRSGPHEVQLRYALASDATGTVGTAGNTLKTDTGASQYGLAYAYEWSKNVKFVGSFTDLANAKNAKFTSGSGFAVDTGAAMRQIAIGLAASF